MVKTKITFHLKSDIKIPVHLCGEAVEVFINHLEKYFEAQRLKDAGTRKSLINQSTNDSCKIDVIRTFEAVSKCHINNISEDEPLSFQEALEDRCHQALQHSLKQTE